MISIGRANILIVEDSPTLSETYASILSQTGVDVVECATAEEALDLLTDNSFELMLLDLQLPGMSGLDLLDRCAQLNLHIPTIVVTATASVKDAITCMNKGVKDFLEKPVNPARLTVTVNNTLRSIDLEHEVCELRSTFQPDGFEGFIGSSEPMQSVYNLIRSAAPSVAPVFITGESGTGKEVCAEAIHKSSDRANGPFVALNCAAIPSELIESELFGHIKGAFTGATANRTGAAEAAHGGTLFLDELCEMQIELQSKLLRFLQTNVIKRVGEDKQRSVDVRIICATNRDPAQAVIDGLLREDLYYRLYVIPIDLPPLRERGEDIVTLAEHFLEQYATAEGKPKIPLDERKLNWLRNHPWPGNVRELQNWVRQLVVLEGGNTRLATLQRDPQPVSQVERQAVYEGFDKTERQEEPPPPSVEPQAAPQAIRPLSVEERIIIERAIATFDNNIPRAAAALEVSPSTIYRKIQQWQKDDEKQQQANSQPELADNTLV